MSTKSILLLIFVYSLFQINFTTTTPKNQTINAVLGDVSFVDEFGRLPNDGDSETLRITTHLKYVTSLLESADVSHLSTSQLKNRQHLISLLKTYTEENPFPINYDYLNERRPTFIDKHGNICAVGYLVQQTAGQGAAKAINTEFKYEYLMEMESELLDGWLAESGLTKKEAAMIQPAYGPSETVENNIRTDYLVSSIGLAFLQVAGTSYSLSDKYSAKSGVYFSTFSSGLASTSIILGLYNLNRYESTKQSCCFSETTVVNEHKRNFSIANIAFGSASLAFNVYRGLKLNKKRKEQRFSFIPSVTYQPGIEEPIPTANLHIRF
ncbi:MAG: hypothetical protein JJ971_15995 [Balneolaceae bacterium]|nr:hypothetical protein [Balneolaceae bacterium]MBO6547903.1 hypothetical protein [Balneolaceae bacterium]MBO6648416.1 hypothetical protein [Balneolaceae bacterium]